jgi:hypothetical protein
MPRPKQGYFLRDGTKVPGVTDIIKRFKNSEALIRWAFGQGKLGRPSLYAHLENEANVGTVVHDMADFALAGKLEDEIIEFARKALPEPTDFGRAQAGFRAYQQWAQAFRVRVVDRELSIVSEKHKVGMTLDRVVLVGNALALLDFKTASGVYPDHLIQLAAYRNLYEERFPGRKLSGGCHLIRLPKDGTSFEHREFADLRKAWQLFKLYRAAYAVDQIVADRKYVAGTRIVPPRPQRRRLPRPNGHALPSYAVTVSAGRFEIAGRG